jgi:hypothetical protein
MSDTRDQVLEKLGQVDGYKRATEEHEDWVAALIRGECTIAGARVRLEWIDPRPDLVDVFLAAHPK